MNSSRFRISLLVLICVLYVAHALYYWPWLEDDTFITLRYAQNLSDGQGLVFNAGQRVEGYSNFAWVMLAGAAIKLRLDPLLVLRGLGLLSGLLTLLFSWRLALRLRPSSPGAALLAPLLLAAGPILTRHAVTGLETLAYTAALSGGLLLAGTRRTRILVAVLLLLSSLRPEGVAFALLILAWRWVTARDRSLVAPAVFLCLFLGYYAWRWSYFGEPLANTFHFKMTGGLAAVRAGRQYILHGLRDNGGAAAIGLSLTLLAFRPAKAQLQLIALVVVAQLCLVLAVGGDWMHHYRFLAPIAPLLAATGAAGAGGLLSIETSRTRIRLTLIVILAVVGVHTLMIERIVARSVMPSLRADAYLWQGYRRAGLWLRENTRPDDLIAVSDIGAVGYFSGHEILDMFGLVNPHIARRSGAFHFKCDPQYVLSQSPDIVLLVSRPDGSYWRIPDRELAALPEFNARYRPIHDLPIGFQNETIGIYRLIR